MTFYINTGLKVTTTRSFYLLTANSSHLLWCRDYVSTLLRDFRKRGKPEDWWEEGIMALPLPLAQFSLPFCLYFSIEDKVGICVPSWSLGYHTRQAKMTSFFLLTHLEAAFFFPSQLFHTQSQPITYIKPLSWCGFFFKR